MRLSQTCFVYYVHNILSFYKFISSHKFICSCVSELVGVRVYNVSVSDIDEFWCFNVGDDDGVIT